MTKKILIAGGVILSLLLSVLAYSFAAADDQPAIELDGNKLKAAAHIDGGNVYLPLRAVGEALGYKIGWSEKDHTVSVSKDTKSILIDLKSNKITANDHVYFMSGEYSGTVVSGDAAAENSTYMRADFFSDNFGLTVRWDRKGGKVILESVEENPISIKTVKVDSEKENLKITLQYPQIQGLDDKAVQDDINSIFVKSATNAANEGLQNVHAIEKDTAGYTGRPIQYETYFDYRIKYNQKGLLSVVFLNYQYTGGAHGLTVQSSHIIDLKTGEEYKLKDLMRSDADYVSFISDTVRDEINERVKEGILHEIEPFKSIREDQDFYLSNHAVVVYFQQYEYFPYAAGIQKFPVDFSLLKDMLKPDFSFLASDSKCSLGEGISADETAGEGRQRTGLGRQACS